MPSLKDLLRINGAWVERFKQLTARILFFVSLKTEAVTLSRGDLRTTVAVLPSTAAEHWIRKNHRQFERQGCIEALSFPDIFGIFVKNYFDCEST